MARIVFTQNIQRHVVCPETEATGGSVREVLDNVFAANPQARSYVLDDQAALRRIRHAVGDAEIDQTGFFTAGHDFDRMPEGLLGRPEKRGRRTQASNRVRGDCAHALVRQNAQALAEARQARQSLVAARLVQAPVGTQARSQAHAVAQTVDDAQFAVLVACDDQMKTVRAEIDGRQQFAIADFRGGAVGHGRSCAI